MLPQVGFHFNFNLYTTAAELWSSINSRLDYSTNVCIATWQCRPCCSFIRSNYGCQSSPRPSICTYTEESYGFDHLVKCGLLNGSKITFPTSHMCTRMSKMCAHLCVYPSTCEVQRERDINLWLVYRCKSTNVSKWLICNSANYVCISRCPF